MCVHTNLKLRLENKLFSFSETHGNQRNLMFNTSMFVDQNNSRKTQERYYLTTKTVTVCMWNRTNWPVCIS